MRIFSARETERLLELDGIELAGFHRRAFAFLVDWSIIGVALSIVLSITTTAYVHIESALGHPASSIQVDADSGKVTVTPGTSLGPGHKDADGDTDNSSDDEADKDKTHRTFWEKVLHILSDSLVPVAYFGFFLWRGKGQTPGKRLMKVRVVSLVHAHISFWHSVERALGYGAAALEGGFGFVQFFIHPYRRCVQDRIAETIVVTERSFRTMQHKHSHPLLPDTK